jgi:hypothetical protein
MSKRFEVRGSIVSDVSMKILADSEADALEVFKRMIAREKYVEYRKQLDADSVRVEFLWEEEW